MKKLVSLLLVAVLAFCCACPALAAGNIGVTVNDKAVVWTDARPFIDENGRTLCPLRAVADAMGMTVGWAAETKTATFTRQMEEESAAQYGVKYEMAFPVGSTTATLTIYSLEGGAVVGRYVSEIAMDTAAVIVDGRTYAPARYLAEAFDYGVEWNGGTRTVEIYDFYYNYDVYSPWKDTICVYFTPARGFDSMSSVSLVSAAIDGAAAQTKVLSGSELDSVREHDSKAFYAFYIYGSFKLGSEYELSWIINENAKNGQSFAADYSDMWYEDDASRY